MSEPACPRCHLPKDDSAWQCDGCGLAFTTDFAAVRANLEAELASRRRALWTTLGVAVVIIGGVVFLAMRGKIIISVPVMLGVIGSIGHAVHRISVVRGHLRDLDRRHVPLPTATIHSTENGERTRSGPSVSPPG